LKGIIPAGVGIYHRDINQTMERNVEISK